MFIVKAIYELAIKGSGVVYAAHLRELRRELCKIFL